MLLRSGLYRHLGVIGPFGLSKGQSLGNEETILSSTFWFNAAGNPLGYGDIGLANLIAICSGLPPDECMVIMTQHEGGLRADTETIPIEALATLATFIVTSEAYYHVNKYGEPLHIHNTEIPGLTYQAADTLLQRFLPLPE